MKKKFILFFIILLTSFSQVLISNTEASFLKKNEKDFSTYTLNNKIPVIFKKNPESKTITLKIISKSLSPFLKPEDSGSESLLFTMMTKGSKKYTNDYVQALLYQKQASFTAESNQNGSSLTLSVISNYFNDFYPVFEDGFLFPRISAEDFEVVINTEKQRLFDQQNTPFSLLQYTIRQNIYKNHPFAVSPQSTPKSLPNIQRLKLKYLHAKIMNASRLTIIATGNFDEKRLLDQLNKSFSFIDTQHIEDIILHSPITKGNPILTTSQSSKNTGFLARVFPAPSIDDKDYFPSLLAASIFQEILFNTVREKYGACYSIGTNIVPSKASYGLVYVYRASNINDLPKYISEAESIMAKGEVIVNRMPSGNFELAKINTRLDGFKNSLINSLFVSIKTNSGVATQIANGLFLLNMPDHYITAVPKIREVTVDDIKRVFDKYWLSSDRQWFIVTGPEDAKKVNLNTFQN
ncbi:MAG: M16 family metallopeptidase [Treponemataceae bacterium]